MYQTGFGRLRRFAAVAGSAAGVEACTPCEAGSCRTSTNSATLTAGIVSRRGATGSRHPRALANGRTATSAAATHETDTSPGRARPPGAPWLWRENVALARGHAVRAVPLRCPYKEKGVLAIEPRQICEPVLTRIYSVPGRDAQSCSTRKSQMIPSHAMRLESANGVVRPNHRRYFTDTITSCHSNSGRQQVFQQLTSAVARQTRSLNWADHFRTVEAAIEAL